MFANFTNLFYNSDKLEKQTEESIFLKGDLEELRAEHASDMEVSYLEYLVLFPDTSWFVYISCRD